MGDFTEKGIFIHTKDIQSPSMLECLQSLHSTCPDVKFTSVVCDNEFRGFRVHFAQPGVEIMLREKYKLASGSAISVYPLTTYLMIHDFNPKESNMLQSDLCSVIEKKFGEILNQRMIKGRENQQAFLVDIDIPEIKDLNVFYSNGYPNMEIKLSNLSKSLKVTFWCRHCKKHGHTYQECVEKTKSKKSNASEKSKVSSNKRNDIEMQARSKLKEGPLNLAKADKNLGVSNYLVPNETFASRIGREQILKAGFFPGDQETLDQLSPTDKSNLLDTRFNAPNNNFQNDNIISKMQIKQEVNEEVDGNNRHVEGKNYQTREMSENIKDPVKEEPDSLGDQLNDQETCPFPSDEEDEIQFISHENTSSSDKFLNPGSSKLFASFEKKEPARRESSGASETSPQPGTGKPLAFKTFSGIFDASSSGKSPRQQPKPSTSHEISTSLSDQLEECFIKAYERYPILDRKTLDAFLIHVKKKSNPKRVASNYTRDVEGLKNQLQHILHFYYNTPQTGTKEDIQFIKWLNGLVDRFEGTIPRKRKRNTKDDKEVTPTKIAHSFSHN